MQTYACEVLLTFPQVADNVIVTVGWMLDLMHLPRSPLNREECVRLSPTTVTFEQRGVCTAVPHHGHIWTETSVYGRSPPRLPLNREECVRPSRTTVTSEQRGVCTAIPQYGSMSVWCIMPISCSGGVHHAHVHWWSAISCIVGVHYAHVMHWWSALCTCSLVEYTMHQLSAVPV